jgi:membrane-bound lytic murein transglycosylase F
LIKKLFILIILIEGVILSCSDNSQNRHKKEIVAFDLDSIMVRGRLIAVMDFNSTDYFIYRGEPMGFHYDLLKTFTDHLGIDLEIIPDDHLEHAYEILESGKADVIAMGLTVNGPEEKEIQFTEPVDSTRQVIVQRKPRKWETMPIPVLESKLLRKTEDLAGKTIYVQKGSSNAECLHLLAKGTGKEITVIEVPYESENLVRLVETGEIDYAVCNANIASVNAAHFHDIDVKTQVSSPRNLAWGIRAGNSDKLLKELNDWIKSFRKTRSYTLLYAKYFKNFRSDAIFKSDYYASNTGKVSPWDDIIKLYSEDINWDWRLLASLIYQESRFIPDVKSKVGAFGLMQLMPETGKHFGIDITASPQDNIKAGTRYIYFLHSIFDAKIADPNERTKFILAAYNAGPGHVLDAMKLAEKFGRDPHKWDDNVAVWLQKKSEPEYYTDIVVKNGYFKGKESIAFVNQILNRYEHYKNIVPDNNEPLQDIPRSSSIR